MKKTALLLTITLAVAAIVLVLVPIYADDKEVTESLKVDQIPADVMEVVKKIAPGFVIKEAERETEGNEVSYSFEGTSNGYEVELEIEFDSDDDDDDDDAEEKPAK